MVYSEDDRCVFCKKYVQDGEEGLQCDSCSSWQHRACQTGVTKRFYRKMVQKKAELKDWRCFLCKENPQVSLPHELVSFAKFDGS